MCREHDLCCGHGTASWLSVSKPIRAADLVLALALVEELRRLGDDVSAAPLRLVKGIA